jgi:hypothetical protein
MYVYSSVNCAKKNVYHPLDVTEFYYNYAVKQLMVIWRVDLIKRRWRSTVGAQLIEISEIILNLRPLFSASEVQYSTSIEHFLSSYHPLNRRWGWCRRSSSRSSSRSSCRSTSRSSSRSSSRSRSRVVVGVVVGVVNGIVIGVVRGSVVDLTKTNYSSA